MSKVSHKDIVEHLRNFVFVKAHDANRIVCVKPVNHRTRTGLKNAALPTEFTLLRVNGSGYILEPPFRPFVSRTSHFDYSTPENRWTRDKTHIINIFKLLKKTEVWDLLLNKKALITLNTNNTHINKAVKGAIEQQLLDLIRE